VKDFKNEASAGPVLVGISHKHYPHMVQLSDELVASLRLDLDSNE